MKLLNHAGIPHLLTTLFTVGTLSSSPAATINLLPEADTYIRDSAPTFNFGTANPILVGIAATPFSPPRQNCLFRFSLTGIPAGAVVTRASLRLIAVAGPREPYDFDLSRVLVNWTEVGATWNVRLPGTPWAVSGVGSGSDYVASPSATAVLSPVPVQVSLGGQPVTNVFSSTGMAADVQLWLDNPGTNFGWILQVAGGQVSSGRQLASREDPTLKPVLTVEYTVPGTPTVPAPPIISGPVLEAGSIRFSFNAESNRTYTVQFADTLPVGKIFRHAFFQHIAE